MTHTPGPWCIDGKPGYEALEIKTAERRIARILYHLGSEDDAVDANAALIAAAPDLLAALVTLEKRDTLSNDMTGLHQCDYCGSWCDSMKPIDHAELCPYAAIAKAEGS
jgi:hypothetical protein